MPLVPPAFLTHNQKLIPMQWFVRSCLLLRVGRSPSGQGYPIASGADVNKCLAALSVLVKDRFDRSNCKQGKSFCWQEMGTIFGCCDESASLTCVPDCDSLVLAGGWTKETFHREININIMAVDQNMYNYHGWPSRVCCSLIDVDEKDFLGGWTSLGKNHGVLKSIETLLSLSFNFFIC